MSTTVRRMLEGKSAVYTVTPGDAVFGALQTMAAHNIGAVLVVENGRLAGILSERDYARKVILQGKSSRDTLVRDIMTPRVVCVAPSWTAHECMALMTEQRVRHLPVMDGDDLVGVVSIGDVVRAVVDEQQLTIDSLERYIASGA